MPHGRPSDKATRQNPAPVEFHPTEGPSMSGWIVAAVLVGIFGRGIFGRESVLVSLAWIRENVSDISGVFLAAVGVFMTVIPRKAARIEDNPIYIRTAGVVLIITAVTGLWFGSRDKKGSREQIQPITCREYNPSNRSGHRATTKGYKPWV